MHRRHWLALALCSSPLALAKGKRVKHAAGFSFELPDKWRWEIADTGCVLLPPGIAVDPEREDNAEVYAIHSDMQERAYIDERRGRYKAESITIDRGGDLENFSTPGLAGVIYTFDFVHPKRKLPFRERVFAMTPNGRSLLLVASGVRERVALRDRVLREVARTFDWK